jgi:virulence-associated protein VagC
MSGEDVMSPVNVLNSLPQKPWFTVLSLGQMIAAEQVKVQLNPLSRILLIKAYPRTFSKQQHQQQKVQHLLTLPKNIRMDKLQVRLTTRGELVVIAPFKFTQQGESGNKWFGLGEEDSLSNVMNTLYQQQGNNPLMQWIPIPIHTTRSITRNASSRSFYGPYQSGTETESTSSSSSDTSSEEDTTSCSSTSTSESESECESDLEEMNLAQRFTTLWTTGTSSIPINKEQVQKYLRFVKKIFYPNMVEGKVVPMENITSSTPTTTKRWQLVLNIKFVQFRPETDQVNVHLHESKSNVLVVEGKRKIRQLPSSLTTSTSSSTTSAVKYVRREIFVPEWLNVQKMVFRGVQENGVLRIVLPIRSTTNPMFKKISNKRSTCGSGKSHSYSPMPLNNIYITKSALSQQCGKKQQQKQLSQRTSRCQYSS